MPHPTQANQNSPNDTNEDNHQLMDTPMQIWVDADACPKIARELIIKTAIRTKTLATFVANQQLSLQKSPFVTMQIVRQGADVADNYIVEHYQVGDLVLTNDIPLANDILTKSQPTSLKKMIKVMNFSGHIYTPENIKQSLNMRDFMETMRGTGILNPSEMGGQKPYCDKSKKAFADGLNRLVSVQ